MFPGEERDGSIECAYFEHLIEVPRDPSSGFAGPNPKHKVVLLRKLVDSTSPLFARALTSAEKLETVTFRFVSTAHNAGALPPIYFVRLTGASVASIKQYFFSAPSGMYVGWQLMEEICLYYLQIEWGFNDNTAAISHWPGAP